MNEPFHEERFQVRYQETDQMGVVHHSQYAVWFEVGRIGLIDRLGLSYGELEKKGMLLPVVDLRCRYVASARFGDEVGIRTQVDEIRGPKLTFAYEVVRVGDKQRLSHGKTIHLWVDGNMKPFDFERKQPDIARCLRRFARSSEKGE
ncbi:acyl-CoA thioesterase [Desmospora activa]|nr:thioesterase family protein [Desmospora activa]